jgi:hypothetical protein
LARAVAAQEARAPCEEVSGSPQPSFGRNRLPGFAELGFWPAVSAVDFFSPAIFERRS